MQILFLYGAGAKGDGADTFSEQHGSRAQRFFGCFTGGAHTFLGTKGTFICVMRANSQLVTNIIIGPLFEKIALSKFILTVTGHKLSLSEGLAGAQVFCHTNRSGAGTFLHLKMVLLVLK